MIAALLRASPWAILAVLYAVCPTEHAQAHLVGVCVAAFIVEALVHVAHRIALDTERTRAITDAIAAARRRCDDYASPAERLAIRDVAATLAALLDTDTDTDGKDRP